MNDTVAMGIVERRTDLHHDLHRVRQREGLATQQQIGERTPLDVLHDDERSALGLAHVVNGDDRRMREPAGRHGFLMKALLQADARLVEGNQLRAEDLHGHQAIELGIVCLVHDATRAAAELREDLVAAVEDRRAVGRLQPGRRRVLDHRMSSLNVSRSPPIAISSPSRSVARLAGWSLTRMRYHQDELCTSYCAPTRRRCR